MKKKTTVLIAACICSSLILGWHNVYARTSKEYIEGLTRGLGNKRGVGGTASRPVEKPGGVQDRQDRPPLHATQVQSQKSTAELAMQLQFGLDSATLLPAAVAELENLADALDDQRLRDYKFQIEGHTCDLGSAAHNMELSRRRAYAVADWLSNHTSLSPEQFEVHWFGESCPLVPNTDEYARRKNRRVVIRNTGEVTETAHSTRSASLEIIHYTKNGEEIIGNGEQIPSGGKYSLNFSTSSKPYAYVCQVDAKGNTTVLFPNSKYSGQSNPVQPKTRYSLPEDGKTFFLDTTTGEEQIFVLMLEQPLDDPQRVCSKMATGKNALPALVATTRGIGGVISVPPETGTVQDSSAPAMAEAKTINLCETMYGGRTRGLGGITHPEDETAATGAVSPVAEKSCEGIILRRSFIHTP